MKSDAGELVLWRPGLFPYDDRAARGICRFAPNCGGVDAGRFGKARPDHPTCPEAPAEYAEKLGMDDSGDHSAQARYMALCRPRAIRRFGQSAVTTLDSTRSDEA